MSDAFDQGPFGWGPFPAPGQSIPGSTPHPPGGGYGGVGISPASGSGTPYGLGAWGSTPSWPGGRPRLNIRGGYGGDPFGLAGYGGVQRDDPYLASASSVNGYGVEVFFSTEMDASDEALTDVDSWSLQAVFGAAPTTILAVYIERLGAPNALAGDYQGGVLSVILQHTGTTLGGQYRVIASGMHDLSGNMLSSGSVPFLAIGTAPSAVAMLPSPDTGEHIRIVYSHPMLPPGEEPGAGPGLTDVGSYSFSCGYPVQMTPLSVVQQESATEVLVNAKGMTSVPYDLIIGPALAFQYSHAETENVNRVGTGAGTVTQGASYLLLSTAPGEGLTLEWQDTSGGILPVTSTIHAICTVDFTHASFDTSLDLFPSTAFFEVTFQDGIEANGILVQMICQRSALGADQIRILSGTYDVTIDADWSTGGPVTFALVRNQKAGIYTFLLNGSPLSSTLLANITGTPDTQAGIRFRHLPGAWGARSVRLHAVSFSASTTVYSAAWNFVHDLPVSFTGSSALTRRSFLTNRGPLVKAWGDATPATTKDVTVRVNDVVVPVLDVNPYTGEITLETPIPLLPALDPQLSVQVDYHWMRSPLLELAGLNTQGLVLNKAVNVTGQRHSTSTEQGVGAPDTQRFPYTIVLGPRENPQPLQVAWRYMGFERAMSALLNSPTTMVLNQPPGQTSVAGWDQTFESVAGGYDGQVSPTQASPAWSLTGADAGGVGHSATVGLDLGAYTVLDQRTDSTAFYHRGIPTETPAAITVAARLYTTQLDNAPTDGVFTGVAFGFHDTRRLYLVGCLVLDGLPFIGFLTDPTAPHLEESWRIGPTATMNVLGRDSGTFAAADLPGGFQAGVVFRIPTGDGAGIYTVTATQERSDGQIYCNWAPQLPISTISDRAIYLGVHLTVQISTSHYNSPSTLTLTADTGTGEVAVRVAGSLTGLIASWAASNPPPFPTPSSMGLLFTPEITGQIFWGSVSPAAHSSSTWSFIRYGLVPKTLFLTGHSVTVNTYMEVLPWDEPSDPWTPLVSQGGVTVTGGDGLRVQDTISWADRLSLTGFTQTSPFLRPDSFLDLRFEALVERSSGSGGTEVMLDTTEHLLYLRPLLIQEGGSTPYTWRRLIQLRQASFGAITPPSDQGWALPAGSTLTGTLLTTIWQTTQTLTARGLLEQALSEESLAPSTDEGRILEARLELIATTPNSNGDTGVVFGCEQPGGLFPAYIQVEVTSTEVRLRSATSIVRAYSHAPDGPHTYTVLTSTLLDSVTLLVDGSPLTPSVTLSAFEGGTAGTTLTWFGSSGRALTGHLDGSISATVAWHHVLCYQAPPASALRTWGLLRGGAASSSRNSAGFIDLDNLDNYEIPRTDTTHAPHTWQDGPLIEPMDWREQQEGRLLYDPSWGVTFLRPDLPLPPYHTTEDGTPGAGFAADTAEPSAGWINLEHAFLPRASDVRLSAAADPGPFGRVTWGALTPEGLSSALWRSMRYRVHRHPTEERLAPLHMVLNQSNVVTSGDSTRDTTLERVELPATGSPTSLSLRGGHIYAKTIYKIIDGDVIWTSEHFVFDAETQEVSLLLDTDTGTQRTFSSEVVEVLFVPGYPITSTHLQSIPLLDSVTLLGDSTPPTPLSHVSSSYSDSRYYASLQDPEDPLNGDPGFALNDSYRALTFRDPEGTYYDDLDVFTLDNGGTPGLVTTTHDGDGPSQIELSGAAYTGATPSTSDSQQGFLMASGGSFLNPTVTSGGMIIPGGMVAAGGRLGVAPLYVARATQRTEWFIRQRSVLTGGVSVPLEENILADAWDEVAPSLPPHWPTNPGTAPVAGGRVLAMLQRAADFSRVGPWGGLPALSATQDSGTFELLALEEGSSVAVWDRDLLTWVTFTARATPISGTDFLLSPSPHTALAAAIEVSLPGQYSAHAGLSLSGNQTVLVATISPVTEADPAWVSTDDASQVALRGIIPYPGGVGLLTGGTGILQASLLAGGDSSLDEDGVHQNTRSFTLLGGAALPIGSATVFHL